MYERERKNEMFNLILISTMLEDSNIFGIDEKRKYEPEKKREDDGEGIEK